MRGREGGGGVAGTPVFSPKSRPNGEWPFRAREGEEGASSRRTGDFLKRSVGDRFAPLDAPVAVARVAAGHDVKVAGARHLWRENRNEKQKTGENWQ